MTDAQCACHLSREVRRLRDDADSLRSDIGAHSQELADLREQMATRDQPEVSRTAISSIQTREWAS